MKQFSKGMVAGLVTGSLLFGTAAFATTGVKSLKVAYQNIKILVDGRQVTPDQEPFTINGTTYVPLRFVSQALGKEVNWNGATHTISIGAQVNSKSYDLNTLEYLYSQGLWQTNGPETDYTFTNKDDDEEERTDGLIAKMSPFDYWASATYNTGGKYSRITGTLELLEDTDKTDNSAVLQVLGDGKLIYQSPAITGNGKTINVDVNIKGYQNVTIKLYAEKRTAGYKNIWVNLRGAKIYE